MGGARRLPYAYKRMSGDFRATVDLKFTSPTPKEGAPGFLHRKGGIVVRQDLDTDSAYVDVLRMGNAQMSIQYRETKGGLTHLIWINTPRQASVRMEKIGDYFYISVLGRDGRLRRAGGSFKVKLTGPYYFGLGVCPHDDNITETMEFTNLRIDRPAPFPKQFTLQTMRVANQVEQIAVGGRSPPDGSRLVGGRQIPHLSQRRRQLACLVGRRYPRRAGEDHRSRSRPAPERGLDLLQRQQSGKLWRSARQWQRSDAGHHRRRHARFLAPCLAGRTLGGLCRRPGQLRRWGVTPTWRSA